MAVAQQAGLMKDNVLPRVGKGCLLIHYPSFQVQFLVHPQQHLILSQQQVLLLVREADLRL